MKMSGKGIRQRKTFSFPGLRQIKYTKTLDKWAFIVYFTCNGVDEDSIIFPKDKANRGW